MIFEISIRVLGQISGQLMKPKKKIEGLLKTFSYDNNSCLCVTKFNLSKFLLIINLLSLVFSVKNFFLREHVTLYIWKNIKEFKIQPVYPSKGCLYPKLRFDINTKNDFKKLRNFISNNKIKLNYSAEKIIKLYLKS